MPHLSERAGAEGLTGLLEVPPLDPGRLLAALGQAHGCPGLAFAEPPTRLGQGGEALVDAFRLAHAPPGLAGPLVLRRILPLKEPRQVLREAAAHDALAVQGFPVPRVLHVDDDRRVLGAPFLVMERLPGRILLAEITRPGSLGAHPLRLPRLLLEALGVVPRLLGGLQARLHGLDPEPLRRRLAEAGFPLEEVGFGHRLARLAERIAAGGHDGLAPGLAWLGARRPSDARAVICHGDFVFTNVCVEGGRATGVFDWSSVALAEPAYDVAASLARLKSRVPGLPPALAGLVRRVQRGLVARYLASYRRARAVDARRVGYYEAYWLLHELLWCGERRRAGALPDDVIEHRWLHDETIECGLADFHALTGVRLAPAFASATP